MDTGVLFLVQVLFLILQIVLGVLSFTLEEPFLRYISYFCSFIVLYLMFLIIFI